MTVKYYLGYYQSGGDNAFIWRPISANKKKKVKILKIKCHKSAKNPKFHIKIHKHNIKKSFLNEIKRSEKSM